MDEEQFVLLWNVLNILLLSMHKLGTVGLWLHDDSLWP
jgi:hypothetical protein